MKYFIYRLEITDGEHQYYSSGLCLARHLNSAINRAGLAAKEWHEPYPDSASRKNITSAGNTYQVWEHEFGTVYCAVDQVEEIPQSDYDILKEYPSYL